MKNIRKVSANFVTIILILTILLLLLIILFPIEYPLWKEYKKQNYNVPYYLKFFWHRCILLKHINYYKINEPSNTSSDKTSSCHFKSSR